VLSKFVMRGDVDQHIDGTEQFAVVADHGRWKGQGVKANAVGTFGYGGNPANGLLGLDGDCHWTLIVRKEVTVVRVQPPGNAPAVPKNLRLSPREIDAGRVEIGDEAVDVGNVNRNRKGIESSQAGLKLSRPITILKASDERQIEAAFETCAQQQANALLVAADPYFYSQREKIVALAARYHLPAIYEWREFAQAGGLASYGTNNLDDYRLAGIYVGRVLKGENPADLPVMQATKFEFVINLRAAKALGIEVAPMLSARADEVIE
jgi:ABC transporter substrate binding protein